MLTQSNHQNEPASLDEHRAARGAAGDVASGDVAPGEADESAGSVGPPASFEDASAVKRARQIELLREVVDSGDYRPDPGKIAESMLENERS